MASPDGFSLLYQGIGPAARQKTNEKGLIFETLYAIISKKPRNYERNRDVF
jgi:hypothetical protein